MPKVTQLACGRVGVSSRWCGSQSPPRAVWLMDYSALSRQTWTRLEKHGLASRNNTRLLSRETAVTSRGSHSSPINVQGQCCFHYSVLA